jgi:exonuclease VII small subunit
MLDKSDEALAEWITATQNRDLQKLYQDARKAIGAQRKRIETEFHKHYLSEFRKHTSKIKDVSASFSELETSLSLVGEDDLEETLKFKEMATKLRRYCDEELGALDQRIGVLLGDANLAAEDNPFGPESILDAYQQACHGLEAGPKVRDVLRKLFDDYVADSVRSIYKEVNELLVRNSILPKIRYGVSKKPDDKAGGARKGAAKEAGKEEGNEGKDGAEAAQDADAEQNLFSLLQKLVGGGPGAGGGVALPPGAVVLQGAELLGALTQVQRGDAQALPNGVPVTISEQAQVGTTNVLRELKTSSFGAGLVQMDATTLDILSLLFDQLFDDPKVPVGLKGLIGRLQIPMLKVAIADKSFFAKKTHPARQLLDMFGEVAVRLPADFTSDSSTFMHLEAIVQHILDNFQDDVGIFDSAREQLQGVVAEHDRQVEVETRAVAEKVEQTENLAVAKTAAEDEVKVRVQAHKLPGAVLEFLVEHWLRYLLLAHAKSGRGGADWKDAVEVMDRLIWSVEPKSTPEERRKLAAIVPALVRQIIAGLQALGAANEVRERFFGELMKIHTESIEHKDKDRKAPEPADEKTGPPPTLDFTAPVTVKNPYGEGEVNVTGLDFTAPAPNDIKGKKAAMVSLLSVDPPADMAMGDWVEFRPKGDDAQPRAAKVLFITPKKTRYVFSNRQGKDVTELTRPEIVRRLRTGEAVRLDAPPEEPLFDRIMNGLVGKLKAPAQPVA